MTYEEYVEAIVRENMEDLSIRAAVAREERLGLDVAHKTSKGAQTLQNWALAKNPAVYHGGKVK